MSFIHDLENWPQLGWDDKVLMALLTDVRYRQGRLFGHMEVAGFSFQSETHLKMLTDDVVKSSDIEGEHLEENQVRSSIARRLGMDIVGLVPSDRNVDGVVEMMLDATQNYDKPLSTERLFDWHAALFPTGRSGMHRIAVGAFRDDTRGSMQVISGPLGRERVHFEAPSASRLAHEMKQFLAWFNMPTSLDPVLKAALAHFWFVTIHPFEDGNGRIARAISDMQLARSEHSHLRFYSMSTQIRNDRKDYYDALERAQKSDTLDVTDWLVWFLSCLQRALIKAEATINTVMQKTRFWDAFAAARFNERQRLMLNKLLDHFEGNLTTSKWAKITKSSQDTALRDILDLVQQGVLIKNTQGGRSTSYSLKPL